MLKRFQAFISSTYLDLKKERQEAMKAVMHSGCFPAGMELFLSSNTSLLEVIDKTIEDSDIYILIIGGKYGSIDPETGISYTEMEYNLALAKNKHILRFIHEDMDKLPKAQRETDEKKYPLLKAFIARAKNDKGLWVPWKDKGDLHARMSASLAEEKGKLPVTAGWIQASLASISKEADAARGILSKAVSSIQKELNLGNSLCDVPLSQFAKDDEEIRISYRYHTTYLSDSYDGTCYTETQYLSLNLSWSEFYSIFLPHFRDGITRDGFVDTVASHIKSVELILPNPNHEPVVSVNTAHCTRILTHLEAAMILENKGYDFTSADQWTLTERGKRKLLNNSVFMTRKEDIDFS